jgi:SAM-dependent methyltransferase
MSSWAEYWNGQPTIYVDARHKTAHYRQIAADIALNINGRAKRVLDYGCGLALSADLVADRCEHLYLCENAASVRNDLAGRFAHRNDITILSPEELAGLPDGSIDLFVVNSVIQYLSAQELRDAVAGWRPKLAGNGRLLIADVVPPNSGALMDVTALLKFAARNGFFIAACTGLVKTWFSDYRRLRSQVGLQVYDEASLTGLLADCGFQARRHFPNLGHNPARMAFIAVPSAAPSPQPPVAPD